MHSSLIMDTMWKESIVVLWFASTNGLRQPERDRARPVFPQSVCPIVYPFFRHMHVFKPDYTSQLLETAIYSFVYH